METAHIFYTGKKYIMGTEQDYLDNGIRCGFTFFKGYSVHNRPKMNLENVIKEVKNTNYNGVKYTKIQIYTDKFISTEGTLTFIKDKLITL